MNLSWGTVSAESRSERVGVGIPYGCEGDVEATMPLIEKYGLTFG